MYLTKPHGSPDLSQHRARLGTTAHWPEAVIPTAKMSERIVLESKGHAAAISAQTVRGFEPVTRLLLPVSLTQVLPPPGPQPAARRFRASAA